MSLTTDLEQQYGIHVLKKVKVRDVYQLSTRNHGVLCLKSYNVPEAEMNFITQVFAHLSQNDFRFAPKVLYTSSHAYWITREGIHYMLTNWVKGEHPRFDMKEHFKKGIRLLAKFHTVAEGFNAPFIPIERIRYNQLKEQITSDRNILADNPKMKLMTTLCNEALNDIDNATVVKAIAEEESHLAFTHGDYNYPNLMLDRVGSMHMIDFDNTSLHVRMEDLSHILHRNMAWHGHEMLRWVQYYDSKRPLSKGDLHVLHTLLLVPYPILRTLKQNKRNNRHHISIPTVHKIKLYRNELKQLL
jgi:Ser/Thr protein kinase RdoA (MazF antagonist)